MGNKFLFLLLFIGTISSLQAQNMSYRGRLVEPSGKPLGGPVKLQFDIIRTSDSALLCSYIHLSDVPLSNGVFNVELLSNQACDNDAGKTLGSILRTNGASGVAVKVIDITNSGAPKTYPNQNITAAPLSIVAESLAGKLPADFIQVNPLYTNMQDALEDLASVTLGANINNGQSIKWNGSGWTAFDPSAGTIKSVTASPPLAAATDVDGDVTLTFDTATTSLTKYLKNTTDTFTGTLSVTGSLEATTALKGASLQITGDVNSATVDGKKVCLDDGTNCKDVIVYPVTDAISKYYRGDKTWAVLDTSVVPENGNLYYDVADARSDLLESTIVPFDVNHALHIGSFYNLVNTSATLEWQTGMTAIGVKANSITSALLADSITVDSIETLKQNAIEIKPYGVLPGQTSEIRFYERAVNGGRYVGFRAPDPIDIPVGDSGVMWTLPNKDGPAGFVLKTDGSGKLSWHDPADVLPGGPAGGDLTGNYPNPVVKVGAIDSAKILDDTIINDDIHALANIDVTKLYNGTISNLEFSYLDNATSNIQTQINARQLTIPMGLSTQYYTGQKTWATLNTAVVPEFGGTNLYFTDARARTAAVSDTINDGVSNIAPSQNAVYDALLLKSDNFTVDNATIEWNGTQLRVKNGNDGINGITSAHIANNTITNLDISTTAAIDVSKLYNACSNNQILKSNGIGGFYCGNDDGADGYSLDAFNNNLLPDRVFVNNVGNVGVGQFAANAKYPLDIAVAPMSNFAQMQLHIGVGPEGMMSLGADDQGEFSIIGGITSTKTNATTHAVRVHGEAGDIKFQAQTARTAGAAFADPTQRVIIKGDTGNVGIGTSTPGAYRLNVAGGPTRVESTFSVDSATPFSTIYLSNNGTNQSSLFYHQAASATVLQTQGAESLVFGTNATERARISPTGNFGIGTNNPTSKLDVVGDGHFSGNLNIDGSLSVGGTTIGFTGGNLDMYNNLILNIGNAGTDFTAGGGLTLAGALQVNNNAAVTGTLGVTGLSTLNSAYVTTTLGVGGNTTLTGDLAVNGGDITSTGALNITPVGNLNIDTNTLFVDVTNNRVGVGTNAPLSSLDVNGAIRAGGNPTTGTTLLTDRYVSGNLATFGANFSSGGPVIGYGVIPNVGSAGFNSSHLLDAPRSALTLGPTIQFYTGAIQTVAIGSPAIMSEVMRIDNTGNVGIGTISPANLLEMSGGNFVATGTLGTSPALTTAGAGSRMVWNPRKAAFRAGYVSGTQWDNANIGEYSVAMGVGTIARGYGATALGADNTANGVFSIVMGQNNTASTYGETVVGVNATNIAGTDNSFVATDPIFRVGNGASSGARSDAFKILKNGNTSINGDLSVSGSLSLGGGLSFSGGDLNMNTKRIYGIGTNNSQFTADGSLNIGASKMTVDSTSGDTLITGKLVVANDTISQITIRDTNGAGIAAGSLVAFEDSAGVRKGYVGDNSTSDANIALVSDAGKALVSGATGVIINPTAGNIDLSLAGGADLTVNSNQFVVDTATGNIGIGIASPIQALHLQRNQNAVTNVTVENTTDGAASSASLTVRSGVSGASLSVMAPTHATTNWANKAVLGAGTALGGMVLAPGNNPLYISNSSAVPKIVLDPTLAFPRLGIGNVAPIYELDVTGSGHLTGNLIVDGNLTIGGATGITFNGNGNLDMQQGRVYNIGTGNTNFTAIGDLDLNSTQVISNIGNWGTDFTSTGGLNLAGDFNVNGGRLTVAGASGNTAIAGTLGVTGATTLGSSLAVTGNTVLTGDLAVNGGDITSTGALRITPNSGSNLNVNLASTGDLVVNTNHLYVDSSEGFVGIRTSTPAAALHVAKVGFATATGSSIIFGDNIGVSTGTSNQKITIGNSTGISQVLMGQDATHGLATTWSYNATPENAVATIGTIGGNNHIILQQSGGNVGIGTTPTSYKLDVSGNGHFSGNLTVDGTLSVGGGLSFTGGDINMNTRRIYGIGTNNSQFTADGSLNIGASRMTVAATTGNTAIAGTLGVTGNTTLTGDLAVNGGDITSTGALTVTPAANTNLNVALSGTGDFAVNTDLIYADTSADRVAINTNAPATKLHVVTAAANDGFRVSGTATAGNTIGVDLLTNLSASAFNSITQVGDSGIYFTGTTTAPSNAKGFIIAPYNTSAASGLRMTSTGDTTLTGNLTVTKDLTVTNNIVFGNTITGPKYGSNLDMNGNSITGIGGVGVLGMSMTGSGLDMASKLITNIGNTATDFTAGGGLTLAGNLVVDTNVLVVDTTNNRVGIGTTTPVVPLEVVGEIRATNTADGRISLSNYAGGTPNVGFQLQQVNTPAASGRDMGFNNWGTTDQGGWRFINSNLNNGVVRITPDGNLGIGTMAPAASLHVAKSVNTVATGSSIILGDNIAPSTALSAQKITIGNTANDSIILMGQDATHNLLMAWKYNATVSNAYALIETYNKSNPIVLQAGGTNGNVGLGIINPAYKLDVLGDGHFSGNLHVDTDLNIGSKIKSTAAIELFPDTDGIASDNVVLVGPANETNNAVAGYGTQLRFRGGPDWASYNSENSDPIWFARYNIAADQSELRLNIGDGTGAEDRFVVGTINAGTWVDNFAIANNGNATIRGALTVSGGLSFSGDINMNTKRIYGIGTNNSQFTADGSLTIGASQATVSSTNGNIVTAGDLAVNGGDITSTAATLNINPTTTIALLKNTAVTGTLGVSGNTTLSGDIAVNGGDITATGALNITPVGNLNIDANTLFVDVTNNRVGVGTNAPGQLLDINGTGRAVNLIVNGGSLQAGLSSSNWAYFSALRGVSNSYSNLFAGGGVRDNGDGTYTVMTDGGSNFYAAIKMDSTGGNAGAIRFVTKASTGGTSYAETHANINANTRMAIVGSNIGMGTDGPSSRLEVSGSIETGGLLDNDASNFFDGACTDGQYLTGISSDGAISCAASTGSTFDSRFVRKSGDTMTGTLNVPALQINVPGSGTYNKASIAGNGATTFDIEAPLATDAAGGARVPFNISWRGGYPSKGGIQLDSSGNSNFSHSINVNQNIVVGANPAGTSSYAIRQSMGDNDGWRIYGEGGNNDGRMVIETVDDGTEPIFLRANGTNLAEFWPDGSYGGVLLRSDRWYRSQGNTGWYNQTHGGGIHMTDSTWVRTYNGKSFYTSGQNRGGSLYSEGDVTATYNMSVLAGDGRGYKFWDNDAFKIFMASTASGGDIDASSDYNMYFQMDNTGHRGFVFRYNDGKKLAQLSDNGLTILKDADLNNGSSSANLQLRSSGNVPVGISFHRPGHYASKLVFGTDNIFHFGGWSDGVDGGTVKAANFIGNLSGTASNADTVDGYHMNQNVLTSSSPTFNSVQVGNTGIRFGSNGSGFSALTDNDIYWNYLGTAQGWFDLDNNALVKAGGRIRAYNGAYVSVENTNSSVMWKFLMNPGSTSTTDAKLYLTTGDPAEAQLTLDTDGTLRSKGHAYINRGQLVLGAYGASGGNGRIRLKSVTGAMGQYDWHIFQGETEKNLYFYSGETPDDGTPDMYLRAGDSSLFVSGTVYAENGTSELSDRRMKENIKPLGSVLSKLLKLRPVTFQYKKTKHDERKKIKVKPVVPGLIAQEVQPLFPQVIRKINQDILGIDYTKFTTLLIQGMKEQQAIIDENKKKFEMMHLGLEERVRVHDKILVQLQNENKELKKQMGTLRQEMEEIKKLIKKGGAISK